jgi:hypothetical protein
MWTAVAQNKTSWERKNPTPPRLVFHHRCPNRQLTGSKMAFFYSVLIRSVHCSKHEAKTRGSVYRGSFTRFRDFLWIYIGRASFQDPPLILMKFLCCVVIELFNLKDPMRLMQKTYLFSVQIGMPLANASKICRIYGYSTLPDYS